MAALIRASVDALLAEPTAADVDVKRERALRAVGRFRSGHRDLSTAHDRHLAQVLDK